jgi:hypothetical protein
MASNIFLRGQRYWWRWRPGRWAGRFAYFSNHPKTIRISLRTGCAMLAEQRRVRVEAFMDGLHAMRNFQMGAEDQAQFFKSFAEDALDRIIGDRLSLQSPFHDRINMAHARLCTLYAEYGPFGEGKRLNDLQASEILRANGCTTEEILDVLITRDTYANRPPVSDGKIAVHLEAIGLPATRYLLDRARQIALAAMTKACVDATDRFSAQPAQLKLPPPDAMAFFAPPESTSALAPAVASVTAPVHDPIPTPDPVLPTEPVSSPEAVQPDTIPLAPVSLSGVPHDAPFSAVVQKVITMKKGQGLWDAKRKNEVRASANIFIYANGDIDFSQVTQQHMFQALSLMTKLPSRYNHYMVGGKGGFAGALASVAPPNNPGDETEAQRQEREAKIGLHAVTRNKHFTWLKAIIDGAVAAGHPKPEINYRELRLTKKQVKKTDPRKQNEKRPNWTQSAYRTLTSGPVHTGCVSLGQRFEKGDQIIHDGVYWAVLINLNICGRSSEGAGLTTDDIIDDAPVPYFHVRHNALRRLKVDEGERKIPIHPKLIELGLLDYVRKIRQEAGTLGHHALFPEWVHPGGKLDFAWMMRHKFMDPARIKLFQNGTGLVLNGKDVDSHSLRGTGRTALRAHGVNDSTRDYMSGHVNGSIGVDIYETPEGPELLIKAIEGLDPFFEHLRHAPLNCRSPDQLMFGARRGRPSGKTTA